MAILEIGNSYSRLEGLPAYQLADLRKLLSYLPGGESAARFSRFPVKRKSLVDRNGNFPTGLLPNVIAYAFTAKIKFQVKDTRVMPEPKALFALNLKNLPYSDQEKAVEAALQYKRGGIVMPTGSGKTVVIALLIAKLQVPTLVVVPNLEIKKQLETFLLEAFGSLDHISVKNIDSNSFKSDKNSYKCLLLDECHHAAAATYQNLNKSAWGDIYYRFFLSATFFRNDSNEHLLFQSLAGEIIYELTYKQAVAKNYVTPVEAFYLEAPKQKVKGHTWATVYNELVVRNESKNLALATLLLRLQKSNLSALLLVKEIEHGNVLSSLTGVPFVNGQDENTRPLIESFNSGEQRCLIGTTGILGEGVDTRACEYVIIAGLGKAKSAFMQQVGRAVRKYPGKTTAKVFIVKDSSHKWTLAHFNAQKKILLDVYGAETVPFDLEG